MDFCGFCRLFGRSRSPQENPIYVVEMIPDAIYNKDTFSLSKNLKYGWLGDVFHHAKEIGDGSRRGPDLGQR
jgi:hypothetical protein